MGGGKPLPELLSGGSKMNKKFLIIFSLIILLSVPPAFAQRTGAPGGRNFPLSDTPCWTKPYLEVTPEQIAGLEQLHRLFSREILNLRTQYIKGRDELRSLLSGPKPDAQLVLTKQNRLSALQKQMDEISIQYLLKARAIFTPEQLSNLPSGCNLGFNYGSGMGWGRVMGPGKGYGKGRYNPVR